MKLDSLVEKTKEFFTSVTGLSTVKPFKVRKDGSIQGGEGTDAIRAVNEWINSGITLAPKGIGLGKDALGFLFYYETMSGAYERPRILSSDTGLNLISLLLRFLKPAVFRGRSVLMSILRILCANPDIAHDRRMPQLVDDRKVKIGLVLKGQKMIRIFLQNVSSFMLEKANAEELYWPTDKLTVMNKGSNEQSNDHVDVHENSDNDEVSGNADESIEEADAVRYVKPGAYELEYEVHNLSKLLERQPHLWVLPPKADMMQHERWVFHNSDFELTTQQLSNFAGQPLQNLDLNRFVEYLPSPVDDPERAVSLVGATLPFDLSQHNQSQSQVAENMVKRFTDEIAYYANSVNTKSSKCIIGLGPKQVAKVVQDPGALEFTAAVSLLKKLNEALGDQLQHDMNVTQSLLVKCMQYSNGVHLRFNGNKKKVRGKLLTNAIRFGYMLGRYAGVNAKIDLELLIKLHLTSGNFTDHLCHLNPFLSSATAAAVEQMLVSTMLHINRIGQTYRAVSATEQVLKLLGKLDTKKSSSSLRDELDRSAASLVSQLTCKRFYAEQVSTTNARGQPENCLQLDPRFLAFEFIHNIILRGSQIELIKKFMNAAQQGNSMCHQMIMGAGKTTVVGPMLALLSGDGSTLVVQVVPHSLLEMSRGVMREKFSAVIKKAVYTFKFDRFMKVDSAVIAKLKKARDTASVVCANPTAIKSFYLKFIEIMHYIDQTVAATKMEKQLKNTEDLFTRFKVCTFWSNSYL